MVSKVIESVCTFNRDLLGVNRLDAGPALMPDEEARWLYTALTEEVEEFKAAHSGGQLPHSVDALIDLMYFTIGGLWRMGVEPRLIEECFEVVHQANMTKRRGQKASRPTDGTVADAVKPTDWIDPITTLKSLLYSPKCRIEIDPATIDPNYGGPTAAECAKRYIEKFK
jgi:predicted HAD superfamily Cof-like phosphohydrolase